MIAPHKKLSGEQPLQHKANFVATFFEKTLPISIVCILAVGFGPWIYKSIGESTGWGTYTIATFVVGTLLQSVVGGFIGGVSQMVSESFKKEAKG